MGTNGRLDRIIMIPTTHGILQQKQAPLMLMSCSPTYVFLTPLGGAETGFTNTITVTATTGNSWTASVLSGITWVRIDSTTNGTASGSGNGSFVITATKYLSGTRLGSVRVTDSASHTVDISVNQGELPE